MHVTLVRVGPPHPYYGWPTWEWYCICGEYGARYSTFDIADRFAESHENAARHAPTGNEGES